VSEPMPHLQGLLSESVRGRWVAASVQEKYVRPQPQPGRTMPGWSSSESGPGVESGLGHTLPNNRLCVEILM